MMPESNDTSETPAIERIARVLASWQSSFNAHGSSPSSGADVDRHWPDHVDTAVAILKVIREPDAAMVAAGDGAVYRRMIEAAIGARHGIDLPGDLPGTVPIG